MSDKRLDVKMVEYDQVQDMAKFAFFSTRGETMAIWIHRDTFKLMMETKWDAQKYGELNLTQREFKEMLQSQMTSGYTLWFDENSNELMRRMTVGTANNSDRE